MSDMPKNVKARHDEALTVAQLIEELKKLPPDLKVWAEGCDCENPVTSARPDIMFGVTFALISIG